MKSPFLRRFGMPSPFFDNEAGFSPAVLFALAEPGVWYDPSDVANLAWRRNLLTWTEQFDNAAWVKNSLSVTVSANTVATTDPIGGNTADVVSETATTGFHFLELQTAIPFAATQYTFTAYLKQGTQRYAGIHISDGTARGCSIDLQTGTLGTPYGSATASRVVLANGWYRLTVTATVSATASGQVAIYMSNSNSLASYAGNTANNIYIWGAQLELGSVATDYQRISDVNTEVIERFPSATLYQDTAGTTPVTTPGQTVALALDKSKGLVLGPELVTNGDFSSGTGWTLGTNWSISGGRLVSNGSQGTFTYATQSSLAISTGKLYRVEVVVLAVSGSGLKILLSGGASPVIQPTVPGTYVSYLPYASTLNLQFETASGVTCTIDNISVRELPGFHATQATLASRPTYGIVPLGGRRNLLTRTEEFDNAVWLKANGGTGALSTVSANTGVAPDGSTTADLVTISRTTTSGLSFITQRLAEDGTQKSRSFYVKAASAGDVGKVLDTWTFDTAVANRTAVTLSADWVRVVLPAVTLSAGANREQLAIGFLDNGSLSPNTGTVQFLIWGAQLETGSTARAYQRVGSAFDVTETGVDSLSYLFFGGEGPPNDARWLVTPTITPGIDKVQVFAGVRKLSDAAGVVLVEYSADINANAGTFGMYPQGNAHIFGSRGTVLSGANYASATPYSSPITNVITGLGDISGDRSTLRINGTQAAQSTADQGTGNFLAYPLYIGRRGGTTLGFNGFLFGLIVRFGANLDANTITNTETWVAGKTGVTL